MGGGHGAAADAASAPRHLVVVSGHPGSGKTTVARQLAAGLGWPLVSRDDFKELLFDHLGLGDRAWSQKLGGLSYDLMDRVLGLLLATGCGVVAETNFGTQASLSLGALAHRMHYRVLEVCCTAPAPQLVARFAGRAQSGARHPGHQDTDNLAEQAARVAVPYQPVGAGPVLWLETTDLPEVVYRRAREWVGSQVLGQPAPAGGGERPRRLY